MAHPPLEKPPARYGDLTALFITSTLKRSPDASDTDALMDVCRQIMTGAGVSVDSVRLVDHQIALSVHPDMTQAGWERDDGPEIWTRVRAADILVIGTPIWLGEESSVARLLLERLYAHSGQTSAKGRYIFYGKTGGCVVIGNEDGVKQICMTMLHALSHIGYVIPPQAETGWIGEIGPGPGYADMEGGGAKYTFTQRNAVFMSWNLMHMARMLKDNGGLPGFGNVDPERLKAQQTFHPDADTPG
ncbi:flavodoxin family protein [Maricaulaceae bacterium MS644]